MSVYFLMNNVNRRFDPRVLSLSRFIVDDAGLYCKSLRFRMRNRSECGRGGDAGGGEPVGVLKPEGVDEPEERGCSVGTCDRGVEGVLSDVWDHECSGWNGGSANEVKGPVSDSSDGRGTSAAGSSSFGFNERSLFGRVMSWWMRSNPSNRFTAYSGTRTESLSSSARISVCERGEELA